MLTARVEIEGTNVPGHGIEDRNPYARFVPGAMTDELLRHISGVTRVPEVAQSGVSIDRRPTHMTGITNPGCETDATK